MYTWQELKRLTEDLSHVTLLSISLFSMRKMPSKFRQITKENKEKEGAVFKVTSSMFRMVYAEIIANVAFNRHNLIVKTYNGV